MKNSVCIGYQPPETQHKVRLDKPRKVMATEPKWCLFIRQSKELLPSQGWTVRRTDLGTVYSAECFSVVKNCVRCFPTSFSYCFYFHSWETSSRTWLKNMFWGSNKKPQLNAGWPFSLMNCEWTYGPCLTWAALVCAWTWSRKSPVTHCLNLAVLLLLVFDAETFPLLW